MKKFLWLLAVVVVGSSVVVFAESPAWKPDFNDKASFPEWSKASIERMVDLGVVRGYEDKTFKADKYVTRAELAVMMERLYDNVDNGGLISENDIFKLLVNYDGLGAAFEDLESPYRAMIAMAHGDLMKTKDPDIASDELNVSLPNGYHIYKDTMTNYYLLVEGGEDQWYGPFTSKY